MNGDEPRTATRIAVIGGPGSGKTTVAGTLARQLGIPHIELDGIFHLPDWHELPVDEFRARLAHVVAEDSWIVDGNYSAVADLVWARAQCVIWLDLPRPLVMRRLLRRTLTRMARREELWHGNRERWSNLTSLDPQRSILVWAWTRHGRYRERYAAASVDPANAHITVVRLTTPAAIDRYLAEQ